MTRLYEDGALVINELAPSTRVHGAVLKEYAPGPYAFTTQSDIPWHPERAQILSVSIGSPLKQLDNTRLFNELSAAEVIDLKNLDSTEAVSFSRMFSSCTSVKEIRNHKAAFKNEIVSDLEMMFYNCRALEGTLDLTEVLVSNVTRTGQMFRNCEKLTTIKWNADLNMAQVNPSTNMFDGCVSLVGKETAYNDSNPKNKEYARPDDPGIYPGYFTPVGISGNVLNETNIELAPTAYINYWQMNEPLVFALYGEIRGTGPNGLVTQKLKGAFVTVSNTGKTLYQGFDGFSGGLYMWKEGEQLACSVESGDLSGVSASITYLKGYLVKT